MCLPRTRGFTIRRPAGAAIGLVSSPYAGFSLDGLSPTSKVLVSAPYAGVHRCSRSAHARWRNIFPVSGGSPSIYGASIASRAYLPRSRGFTVAVRLALHVHEVSPPYAGFTELAAELAVTALVYSPYAGVHPSNAMTACVRCCIFPVRGGSPMIGSAASIAPECFPRARGFTRGRLSVLLRCWVSSPYAGFTS